MKADSAYDGARFHFKVDSCWGRASSVVVVKTSFSGSGCDPFSIQTCQSRLS